MNFNKFSAVNSFSNNTTVLKIILLWCYVNKKYFDMFKKIKFLLLSKILEGLCSVSKFYLFI